jgi:hypothetical protein
MAERRMFAKTIVTSDAFLDMPPSSRCLYFTLAMFCDDDGFCNNPKSIMRQIGASTDDMNILIAKKFILAFDSGVIVIKHWYIHNYIQNDRYHPTKYQDEKSQLGLDENKAYTLTPQLDTPCIQDVSKTDTEVRLGKDRLGKDSTNSKRKFKPPTYEEVQAYKEERNASVDVDRFIDYYESNGWRVGKNPMKDWKATFRNWERNNGTNTGTSDRKRSSISGKAGGNGGGSEDYDNSQFTMASDIFGAE